MKRGRPVTRSSHAIVTSQPSELKFESDQDPHLIVPPSGHVWKASQIVAAFYDDEKAWFVGKIGGLNLKAKEADVFFFLDQTTDWIPFAELRLCVAPYPELCINPFVSLADEFSSKRLRATQETSFGLILPWGITEIAVVLRWFMTDAALGNCLCVCKSWKFQVEKIWPEEQKEVGKLEFQEYLAVQSIGDCASQITSLEGKLSILTAKYPKQPRKKKGETERKKLTEAQEILRKEILAEKRAVRRQREAMRHKQGTLSQNLRNLQEQIRVRKKQIYITSLPKELQTFNTTIPQFPVLPFTKKILVLQNGSRALTPKETLDGFSIACDTLHAALRYATKGDKIYLEAGVHTHLGAISDDEDEDEDLFLELNNQVEIIGLGEDRSTTLVVQEYDTSFIEIKRCCVKFENISFIQGQSFGADCIDDLSLIKVKDCAVLWMVNCQVDFSLSGSISLHDGSKLFLEKTILKNADSAAVSVQSNACSLVIEDSLITGCGTCANSAAICFVRFGPMPFPTTLHVTIRRTTIEKNEGHALGILEPPYYHYHPSPPAVFAPLQTGRNLILENNIFQENKSCGLLPCQENKICVFSPSDDDDDDDSDDMMLHPIFPGYYSPFSGSDSDDSDENDHPVCSIM